MEECYVKCYVLCVMLNGFDISKVALVAGLPALRQMLYNTGMGENHRCLLNLID